MNLILPTHMTVEGVVTVKVMRPDGRIREESTFKNLITNTGLDLLGATSMTNAGARCAVGTGNTAPAVTDTALVAEVFRSTSISSTSNGNSGSSPYYAYSARTWEFTPGQATGTLAEVGLFDGAAPGNMFSRALIKDGVGAPTTITILADEYLYVTWELRKYVGNESDATGSISISGTSYDYTIRPQKVSSTDTDSHWHPSQTMWYNGAYAYETNTLAAITTVPSGTPVPAPSGSYASYGSGTYYRDVTLTWTPGVANFATGVGCVMQQRFSDVSGYCIYFTTTKLPKDATKELVLTVRHSWSRH